MSSTAFLNAETTSADQGEEKTVLRMLALHGSGSFSLDFASRLGSYVDLLKEEHNTELSITAIDAPVPKDGGFAWWSMPPYVRSFNATEYEGFETSAALVINAIESAPEPFDLIYAHSQGAILTVALLALNRIRMHPTKGYILNGVAWPNPYTEELNSLKVKDDVQPRVLFVTGESDKINPPETQERVKKGLEAAGMHVFSVAHAGGHNIPMRRDKTLRDLVQWALNETS